MNDLLQELNSEQQEVVAHQGGPLLVIAGAGTGKTRVLTYRYAYLVEQGVPVENILLVTFTNKAAKEMLKRAEQLTGQLPTTTWGGTFHHVAHRILRQHTDVLGMPGGFKILDYQDCVDLIKVIVDEVVVHRERDFPSPQIILSLFSLAINTLRSIDEVVNYDFTHIQHYTTELLKIAHAFIQRKTAMAGLDFDDLLLSVRHLLGEYPKIQEQWCSQFHHILVDEFQDTNRLQIEMIDLLVGEQTQIMAVGDDAQAIYSFRGADEKNILGFPHRYEHAEVKYLTKNYRSTSEILELANRSITFNHMQFKKQLTAQRSTDRLGDEIKKPVVVATMNTQQQAQFIAQHIWELHNHHNIELHDIAILYRAHHHSLNLQLALSKRDISFQVRSGLRFFETAHVRDLLAYLQVCFGDYNELSFRRVFQGIQGIGKKTLPRLLHFISSELQKGISLQDVMYKLDQAPGLSKKAQYGIADFQELARDLFSIQDENPTVLIKRIIDSDFEQRVYARYTDAEQRIEDLDQLCLVANAYSSIDEFLHDVTEHNIEEEVNQQHQVCLSSIHQAKGLEWKVVFLVWLIENQFPNKKALLDHNGLAEERRLFYVACTRAKDQLFLVYPATVQTKGYFQEMASPSRFIMELYDENQGAPFEQWQVSDDQFFYEE